MSKFLFNALFRKDSEYKNKEPNEPYGKSVILLHCYLGNMPASNLQASSALLYEACTNYNLKVLSSLWSAVDNPYNIMNIITILQAHSRYKKVIVITNDYKLIENNSSKNNAISDLIDKGSIELYQAERKVVLTKIKVNHA